MVEFADFLAPFDARKFHAEYSGRRPVHIPAARRARAGILPWARLNELLAIAPYWNEDSLKLYFNNRGATRETYCDIADVKPGTPAPANPARVRTLVGLGASLVANGIHRLSPEIGAVVHALETEFAAHAFANVYCSFKNVQAFQTHYDLHDVFALQTEGEKTWRIYEGRADNPTQPLPHGEESQKWLIASRGPLLFEAHMRPGDLLYLPRGQYHDALTGAQASLHVTFGVQPAAGVALFELLESALTREAAFRAYLPPAREAGALRERLAHLADRVRAVMTSPAFMADVDNHQRGLASVAPDYDLPVQRAATWYAIARPASVVRRDDGYFAVHEGRDVALGAAYPAVEWALQQRFFSVEDALARYPAVPLAALHDVLERLVQAQVIARTEMQQAPAAPR